MKNPNGLGTVYKMSGKRRKKWRVQKTIGWENGKQKRITVGYFETFKEADKARANYVYNPNAKLTIKDVYKMWSEVHYQKLSENSRNSLKSRYDTYVSKLENNYISDVKLKDLQDYFNNLTSSSATLNVVKNLFHMIFEYAVKNDFIQKNPVKYIELGKYKKVYDKKIFTLEEIDILWHNLNIPYVDTILILIYTGMRVREMLNLKLSNINLENNTIYILKSKTNSGIRYIPIHAKILPLIINRMHNQEYLLSKNNKPIIYRTYRNNFNKALELLKIQPHTPHECRHTTATLLSNAGANTISIAKIMGHTDYNMTANVYTHKDNKELEKAISGIN